MTGYQGFGGQTYSPERDESRLKAQLDRVKARMSDHEWHTLKDLAAYARGSEAAVSARVRDLRKQQFGGHFIERRYVGGGLWAYRLAPPDANPAQMVLEL